MAKKFSSVNRPPPGKKLTLETFLMTAIGQTQAEAVADFRKYQRTGLL